MTPITRTLRDVSCSNELVTVNVLESPGLVVQRTNLRPDTSSGKAIVD